MWTYEIRPNDAGRRQLTLTEAPTPSPGPGEALVRIRASSLNYRDLGVLAGKYPGPLLDRLVPLSDGAGEVVKVGADVTRWQVGDRVAGTFFQAWLDGELRPEEVPTQLGGSRHGMLREYAVLPATGLVRLPGHLSFEEGATLPCAGVTAWNALFAESPLTPGQTVLLLGTGGVSIFALQLARACGARAIITSSSDEKLARARELGAEGTVNYKTTPQWQVEVRRLTDGRGVDHVVEVGGAGTLTRSLQATRLGGRVSVIGVLSGTRSEVDTGPFLFSALTVRGIYVGSRALFEKLSTAITETGLRPVVDRVFGYEEAGAAYEYLRSGRHFGKVVIRH